MRLKSVSVSARAFKPARRQRYASNLPFLANGDGFRAGTLEKLEKLGQFAFPDAAPGSIALRQMPSQQGCVLRMQPLAEMFSRFSVQTRFPRAKAGESMSMGVNPNTGLAFVSQDEANPRLQHNTVTISPFSIEIPNFVNSSSISFVALSEFKHPLVWEKFSGPRRFSDRIKFWMLKALAKKIPLAFAYSGHEPRFRWSINWWRDKEISLCADYVSGNISQVFFGALPEVDFPAVQMQVDVKRKWFDFQFEFLGYHWSVHFSFKQLLSEIFEFTADNVQGLALFNKKGAALVLSQNDRASIRFEFNDRGEAVRFTVKRADGSVGYGERALYRDKADFLPGLGPLQAFLEETNRTGIWRALVEG